MSSKRLQWKNQVILAGSLFIFGAFAFWLEYKHRPAEEERQEGLKRLWLLKDQRILSLSLQGLNPIQLTCAEQDAKLCRVGDSSLWEIASPGKYRAETSNVSGLLSSLSGLTAQETVDLSLDSPEKRAQLLKEYGLDPSSRGRQQALAITVQTEQFKRRVVLGGTHPIGEGWFALVENNGKWDETKVYVLPAYFKSQLDHDLTYWRDKKVPGLDARQVQTVTWSGGKGGNYSATLVDGDWKIRAKAGTFSADLESVEQVLNGLAQMQAKGFGDPVSTKGIATRLEVKLKSKASEIQYRFLGRGALSKGGNGKLWVRVSGENQAQTSVLYELDPMFLDRVNKEPKELRLTKLIPSADRFSAQKVIWKINGPQASTLALSREQNQWLLEGGKQEANTDKVGQILDLLTGNRIRSVVELNATNRPGSEVLTLEIYNDKNELKDKLEFWKKDATHIFGRDLLSESREVLELDPSLISHLPWDLKTLEKAGSGS